jgi:RimJ/RimL family protein N-acetyltransferase
MLYELNKEHYVIAKPVMRAAWTEHASFDSILAGQRAGRVFVDDVNQPKTALVCHHVGNYFPVGEVSEPLRQFIYDAPAESEIFDMPFFAYYANQEVWERTLLEGVPDSARVMPRRTFILEDAGATPFTDWRQQVPDDITIVPLDRMLAERADRDLRQTLIGPVWHEHSFPSERYPAAGYENFVCKSFGYCALSGERVVCAAWAGSLSDSHAAVEIETAEDFRRRGLATLTCAAFLEVCRERGLAHEWICDVDNPASARLALRLGHRELSPIKKIQWRDMEQDFTPSRGLWTYEPHKMGRLWRRI